MTASPAPTPRTDRATAGRRTAGPRALPIWGDRIRWADVRPALARLAAVVAVITAVVVITGELVTHWSAAASIRRGDLDVERTLAAHRTGSGDVLTRIGTQFAETIPVLDLTIFAVDFAARAVRRWRAPAFVALAVGGEKLVYLVSVLVVARARPPVPTVGTTYATASFPSGHVGSAITLYGSVALLVWWSRRARPAWVATAVGAALVLPLVVAFCRMYRGFHYPSDVVTGALIGLTWLATCAVVLRPRDVVAPQGRPAGVTAVTTSAAG